jgi:streptogramin lyase
MNISGLRPRLAALLTAILICVGLLSLSTAPAWAAAGTITEFPTNGASFGITAGPDGNLWFTEFNMGAIGRITPSGSFSTFHIPTAKSGPAGITAGPDGNVWFTESSTSKIGRVTTS